MATNKEDSANVQVEVARIGAKQAVVVALIAATTGIFGTIVSHPFWSKVTSPEPRWYLAINNVELLERGAVNESSPPLRIILIANNQAYSYPSRALWVRAEGSNPGEEFPLPAFTDRIAVRFDALVRRGNGFGQLSSQEVQTFAPQQLPAKGAYELLAIDDGFVRGGAGTTKVRVSYEIIAR